MEDFNATLTRAFAEQHHEPVDDGFAQRVAEKVARRERLSLWRQMTQGVGLAAAGAAFVFGLLAGLAGLSPSMIASVGLEIARAHGALTQASAFDFTAMAAGMTQFLLLAGVLAGAGVAYRNSQQQ